MMGGFAYPRPAEQATNESYPNQLIPNAAPSSALTRYECRGSAVLLIFLIDHDAIEPLRFVVLMAEYYLSQTLGDCPFIISSLSPCSSPARAMSADLKDEARAVGCSIQQPSCSPAYLSLLLL